jgi:hypothetical protein
MGTTETGITDIDLLNRLSKIGDEVLVGFFAKYIDADIITPPTGWEMWLKTIFPTYFNKPFGEHHAHFWEWVWELERDVKPRPYIFLLPRGGGKSVSTTAATVRIGVSGIRNYIWYCSETQEQANQHLEAKMMPMLQDSKLSMYYKNAQPKVSIYGPRKGWRRNRLWASDFVIDAIGLDSSKRGAGIEENRVGLFVIDDIDGKHDSPYITTKKIEKLTRNILPAGSPDAAIIFTQNLIHPNSIASLLGDNEYTGFLANRIINGPHEAIKDLVYETRYDAEIGRNRHHIVSGEPIWVGQDLEIAEEQINEWGPTAFEEEAQNKVNYRAGGLFSGLTYRRCVLSEVPDLVRGCVWVDPAVTDTKQSDSHGIQADGISSDGTIYRLWSWEQVTSPLNSIKTAIRKCLEFGFTVVGVETDQGGDTWKTVYNQAWDILVKEGKTDGAKKPIFKSEKAGSGHGSKVERASKMLVDYENGRIVHVIGTHDSLERALYRFPLTKPYDLVDASYWSWQYLRRKNKITVGGVAGRKPLGRQTYDRRLY